jgi:pyoverdine/dityrosine biosynthesis protein Dit1
MFHKGTAEGYRYIALFRTEEDEFKAPIHSSKNGRPTVFETIEANNAALVEKKFPEGPAPLISVKAAGGDNS